MTCQRAVALALAVALAFTACGIGADDDAGLEDSRHEVWRLTVEPCSTFRLAVVNIEFSRAQKLDLMWDASTQADAALDALGDHERRYPSDAPATEPAWNISSMGDAHDALAENRAGDYSTYAQSALYGCSEADRVLRDGGA